MLLFLDQALVSGYCPGIGNPAGASGAGIYQFSKGGDRVISSKHANRL